MEIQAGKEAGSYMEKSHQRQQKSAALDLLAFRSIRGI